MNFSLDDTIVAIATPAGQGGIGIVRLSGPRAWSIGKQIFQRRSHGRIQSHHLYYGHALEATTGSNIDEGLIAFLRGPHSYTGEDIVEINAHGAPLILRRIVEHALAHGARPAEPGEMTLRAFLHGRIDLAQAEAVADLIAANSDAAIRQSLGQLGGSLSARIREARQAILRAQAPIEASIDFPEEEVPPVVIEQIAAAVRNAGAIVETLLAGAEQGRIAREGVRMVIVGKPNVGKSSLFNALLQADRAIVTTIAGTTRDTLEETALIGGIACHLIDTAGITETTNIVEQIGIERSRQALQSAELVIFVLDQSQPVDQADYQVLRDIEHAQNGHRQQIIIALNKADLPAAMEEHEVQLMLAASESLHATFCRTTTVLATGTQELALAVSRTMLGNADGEQAALVARARHRDALEQARSALAAAHMTLNKGMPLDFVAEELRDAVNALGTITGETATEELLSLIFSEFCIGK